MTARRGEELREHMLLAAKEVFLEAGFERASMDVIAARAGTTKRTLYAHFESKEKLFLAVVELVRGLLISRLKVPGDYADEPREALVLFSAKFLERMIWSRTIQMCRMSIAEVERFPDGAARLYEACFDTAQARVEAFLRERLTLSRKAAASTAGELLGRVIHPRFARALFGLDGLGAVGSDDQPVSPEIDLEPIRRAVAELVPTHEG